MELRGPHSSLRSSRLNSGRMLEYWNDGMMGVGRINLKG